RVEVLAGDVRVAVPADLVDRAGVELLQELVELERLAPDEALRERLEQEHEPEQRAEEDHDAGQPAARTPPRLRFPAFPIVTFVVHGSPRCAVPRAAADACGKSSSSPSTMRRARSVNDSLVADVSVSPIAGTNSARSCSS